MKISKKWSAAAAGFIAIALVGSGAVSANAAEVPNLTPQPNGSPGAFYIYDENTVVEPADGSKVYNRSQFLSISASSTDPSVEIFADDYVEAGDNVTQVYRFITREADLNGGVNTWRAYDSTGFFGPNGGVAWDDFTIEGKTGGNGAGVESVFTEGGEWLAGLAFTEGQGTIVHGYLYRTMHVDAATGAITFDPVFPIEEPPAAPAITTQPVSVATTAGEDAVFTAAASGTPAPTVKWESSTDGTSWADVAGATSATLTVPATTVAQSLTEYRAVFTNAAGSATTNEVQLTVTAAITEPTSPANDATKKTIAPPVDGTVTIEGVAAGTYTAYAWSTPTNLGTVVVPASGIATIPVPAALQDGAAHTFALLQADNSVVAWGNVLVAAPEFPLTSATQLTADVTVSGKFALEGVNAGPIALGTAKRGATTAAVPLGAFTVTDDRDDLKGWTLNAAVAAFTGPAGTEPIPGTALGLAPKKVGDAVDGISVATPKVAGDDWTSTLVAEGAPLSNTVETGTQFDADLTFKAPAKAKKGTYTSTLTLTLASK